MSITPSYCLASIVSVLLYPGLNSINPSLVITQLSTLRIALFKNTIVFAVNLKPITFLLAIPSSKAPNNGHYHKHPTKQCCKPRIDMSRLFAACYYGSYDKT